MVGLNGIGPSTSPLSGVRSNQLSWCAGNRELRDGIQPAKLRRLLLGKSSGVGRVRQTAAGVLHQHDEGVRAVQDLTSKEKKA